MGTFPETYIDHSLTGIYRGVGGSIKKKKNLQWGRCGYFMDPPIMH